MELNFFSIVFLLGALNGFSIAFYLFFSRTDKRQGKYFLGLLIVVLSYDMLETFLYEQKILLFNNDFYGYFWVFSIGPSLYFSIKTSYSAEKISRKSLLLHYSPVIIDFCLSAFFFCLRDKPFISNKYSSQIFYLGNEFHLVLSRILNITFFWIYFVFAFRELNKFQKRLLIETVHPPDSQQQTSINHSKSLLYMSFVIALVWTVTVLGVLIFDSSTVLYFYYPTEFLLAIACYWGGFTMYRRTKVIYLNEQKNNPPQTIKLSADKIDKILEIISKAMSEDKVYLDPELTVRKLSILINLPPKTISAILNQHLQINFNDYINNFRVEEVKLRLPDPQNKNLTILAIAFDSGFNSVTTFQRVFKNKTGLTPKEFLSKNRK